LELEATQAQMTTTTTTTSQPRRQQQQPKQQQQQQQQRVQYEAVAVTSEHKPNRADEAARIEAANG
jgi:hypothetical protein